MRVRNAVYVQCEVCEAPYVTELPEGWNFTVVGNFGFGHFITPHKPGCPNGFVSKVPADE